MDTTAPMRESLHRLADVALADGVGCVEDVVLLDGEPPVVVAGSAEIRAAQALGLALPRADGRARGNLVGKGAVLFTCGDAGKPAAVVTEGITLVRRGTFIVIPKPHSEVSAEWLCWTLRQAEPVRPAHGPTGAAITEDLRNTSIEMLEPEEQARRCKRLTGFWNSSVELVGLLRKKALLLEEARAVAARNLVRHGRVQGEGGKPGNAPARHADGATTRAAVRARP